jgi:uncharacterized membrane protein (Fun14 family)
VYFGAARLAAELGEFELGLQNIVGFILGYKLVAELVSFLVKLIIFFLPEIDLETPRKYEGVGIQKRKLSSFAKIMQVRFCFLA